MQAHSARRCLRSTHEDRGELISTTGRRSPTEVLGPANRLTDAGLDLPRFGRAQERAPTKGGGLARRVARKFTLTSR
jgi:hypothetical protein